MNHNTIHTIKRFCMTTVVAAAVCLSLPQLGSKAEAVSASKCGSYYTYVSNGALYAQRTTTSDPKEIVSQGKIFRVTSCVTDSSYIYYTAVNTSGSKTRLYRVKPDGSGKTQMIELTGKNTVLQGKCGSSLVYTYDSATSNKVHTRRYKLGGTRTYKVRNDMNGTQLSGQYVVGMSYTEFPTTPTSLYSVNGESGDWRRLSRSCVAFQVIDNTIYYVESDLANMAKGKVLSVKACSLDGKNIRTLAQNITGVDLQEYMRVIPTERALYYVEKNGGAVCRYTYSSKSKKTLLTGTAHNIDLNYLEGRVVVQDKNGNQTSFSNKVYTVTPPSSTVVAQASLSNASIIAVSGKTYYARSRADDTVSLGRFS
ncbi:MAG: hypothetical protein ACI4PM_01315 [Butyricicoccus sp.]